MGTVYILKSIINGRYYIGSTNNLVRRLKEHNRGHVKSTKLTRPFVVAFSQEYESLEKARVIEYRLKQLKSKMVLDKIITEKLIKLGS